MLLLIFGNNIKQLLTPRTLHYTGLETRLRQPIRGRQFMSPIGSILESHY